MSRRPPIPMPSPSSALHHVGLQARDFDGTLRFYIGALGFRVRRTWSLPAAGVDRAAFLDSADGALCLEVFDGASGVPGARPSPASGDIGERSGDRPPAGPLLHLALRVPDVDAAFERALGGGARAVSLPRDAALGEPPLALRFAMVRSPNGELVEFLRSDDL